MQIPPKFDQQRYARRLAYAGYDGPERRIVADCAVVGPRTVTRTLRATYVHRGAPSGTARRVHGQTALNVPARNVPKPVARTNVVLPLRWRTQMGRSSTPRCSRTGTGRRRTRNVFAASPRMCARHRDPPSATLALADLRTPRSRLPGRKLLTTDAPSRARKNTRSAARPPRSVQPAREPSRELRHHEVREQYRHQRG